MRYLISTLLLFVGSTLGLYLVAQAPTIQDCLGAISVCEQVYTETIVRDGSGLYDNEIDNDISCMQNDERSIWYTFTVNKTGDFGFLITPDNATDDYDWALYNLTNARCEDIRRDPSLLVSCNAAGSAPGETPSCNGLTGATGQSNFNIQGGGCRSSIVNLANGFSPLNDLIPVQAGNTYALIVANWSTSNAGYTIDFGYSGDIGIIDDVAPEVRSVTMDADMGCSPEIIEITFNENIQCSTIANANFSLTDFEGNSHPISMSSMECEVGAVSSKEFTLTIEDLLPINDYRLTIEGDGLLSIADLCGNVLEMAYYHDFLVTVDPLQEIGLPMDTLICDLPSVTLDVTDPQADQYRWSDNTDEPVKTITTSGVYMVSISNDCAELSASIDVTILNDRDINIDLGPDTSLCLGDSYLLDPGLSGDLSYEWSNGSSSPTLSVSTTEVYTLTVSDACGDLGSAEVDVEFKDLPLDFDLGRDTFFCTGDVIVLDATTVNAVEYEWSDASIEPTLTVGEMGLYSVTVTNECLTASDQIQINESACVDCNVYLPNIMSINGNGDNRLFAAASNCPFIEYHLSVYDRWGGQLYSSPDPSASWDGFVNGQLVNSGTYPYVLRVSYLEFDQLIEEEYTGTILVAR